MRSSIVILLISLVVLDVFAEDLSEDQVEQIIALESEEAQLNEGTSVVLDAKYIWTRDYDLPLLDRLAKGILRSRTVPKTQGEKIRWERCGEVIPPEELVEKALEWATIFLDSIEQVKEETEVDINVWGAFATQANESSFNECALDFSSRKWAVSHKVVTDLQLTYDRETVWKIITSPNFNVRADFGSWQIRRSVKKLDRDQFDEITSVVPGIYLGIKELATRALEFSAKYKVKGPFPEPWRLWPSNNPYSKRNLKYDAKIKSVARWLGARKDEIIKGELVIDVTNNRKRKYKFEKK